MIKNDATLLIKLPSELKGAFKGLCDSKGVTMTEELRRFMANELKEVATGEAVEKRCASTIDMFDPVNAVDADRSAKFKKIRDRYRKGKKD